MTDEPLATLNVTAVTAADAGALLELGDRVREALDPDSVVCPIRDCPGHEGPHGSMWAETWTAATETGTLTVLQDVTRTAP